jgi:hypothetical protein
MTRGDRRRVKRERFDDRRLPAVAQRDVRRKRAEAGFQPESRHPDHIAHASMSLEEGVWPAVGTLDAAKPVHQPFVKINELRAALGGKPQRVAAVATARDEDAKWRLLREDVVDPFKRLVELLLPDELLRQRDVRQVIGVEPQAL